MRSIFQGLSLFLCIVSNGDVPNSDVLHFVVCYGFVCDELYCISIDLMISRFVS